MNWISLLFIILYLGSHAHAQDTQILEVPTGNNIIHLIPEKERYQYDQFQGGTVYFVSGVSTSAAMNLNLLNQEIQFINPVGDTLSIARREALDRVEIGKQLFYYRPTIGYLEILADFPALKLAVHQLIEVTQEGTNNPILADPVSKKQNTQPVAAKRIRTLILTEKKEYFIMDKNKSFHPARRTTFYKIFPDYKTSIRNYLQEHHIRFEQEEDLTQFLKYCSRLGR